MLKHTEEADKFAKDLVKLCNSWTNPCWDELDWPSRLKEVSLRETLESRKKELSVCQGSRCIQCPQFVKHVSSLRHMLEMVLMQP